MRNRNKVKKLLRIVYMIMLYVLMKVILFGLIEFIIRKKKLNFIII